MIPGWLAFVIVGLLLSTLAVIGLIELYRMLTDRGFWH